MFEQYTEFSRRTIFFSRAAAAERGSDYIETEHLLLGLLRSEDPILKTLFPPKTRLDTIAKEVPTVGGRPRTTVDIPLSAESRRVLEYAEEEANRMRVQRIGNEHLLAGLLREPTFAAAQLLNARGVDQGWLQGRRQFGRASTTPAAVDSDNGEHLRAEEPAHERTQMNQPIPIEVPAAPPQNETYSQAVRLGGVIYLSGQLGVRPDKTLPLDFSDEVRGALENVRTVLEAAGSALSLVGRVNIYITDFSRLNDMNTVYREYFPHRPAKTTVEVARLDKGARIEIEVIAAAGS